MGMGQNLLIPFLVGWTSIYQLFWGSPGVQGFDPSKHIQSANSDMRIHAVAAQTVAPQLITLYKEPASDPLGIEGSTVYD